MTSVLKTFVASFVILATLDLVWLGWVMKDFNTRALSNIARMSDGHLELLKFPALLTYIVMAVGLTAFVAPKVFSGTLVTSFAWGSLLGFTIYAVFDLTNLAILKDYPLMFAVVDIAWGTFAFGAANSVFYLVRDHLQ
jgi:uncharacterized membrane protein